LAATERKTKKTSIGNLSVADGDIVFLWWEERLKLREGTWAP